MSGNRQTIIVTGATRGLGRALSLEFSRLGHTVIGCGTRVESLRDLAAEIESEGDSPHDFQTVDVGDASRVEEWARDIETRFGPPDRIINNAGIINRDAPFWEVSEEEFSRVIDVNVKGTANVIRAFLPGMIRSRRGVVIGMSSGAGKAGSPEIAAYCASKFAVEGLIAALALELPAGLAAIAVAPGVVDTEMLRGHYGKRAGDYPVPSVWATWAAPYFLRLGADDNGKSLRIEPPA